MAQAKTSSNENILMKETPDMAHAMRGYSLEQKAARKPWWGSMLPEECRYRSQKIPLWVIGKHSTQLLISARRSNFVETAPVIV
ncbi:hypothetical protein [Ochrobactrum sp. SFR4]|uniref:hypothetical protein n=1 Tax=Ochrobactrum sp. SFR4 TaxID=2717368 RepID=UPI001C8B3639|nr:hypothetical protein [Ochrobactrum sp. SFR4]MBX8827374.1 hypothetical protein [Ochrobactrum sp. SFR4]